MMNKNDKANQTSRASLGPGSCVRNSASPYDDDSEDAVTGTYSFSYFLTLAYSNCSGLSDADVQDIAQEAWISYSRRSETVDIGNPEAYIGTIVRNKFKDHLRTEKRRYPVPTVSLSAFEENPELELAALAGRNLTNPANELDDQVEKLDFFTHLVIVLPRVAPRQRRVVICTLLDNIDDPLLLKQVLRSNHIDASEMCWPSDKAEKQLLQASLPAARRTLASLMQIDLSQFKQKRKSPYQPTPV